MLAVAAGGFLQAQEGAGYYNRNNEYDNYAYADYEFRHSNAEFHMNRYRGDIYYFHHYRANVYFVLVGPNVFVVPALTFRGYMHRPNYHWASRADFIALSAVYFPYYDSYVRFGYYFDYYDHNPWCVSNHLLVTRNYRTYYTNRNRSRQYYRHLNRISAHQSRAMDRARHFRNNRYTFRQNERTYQGSRGNASHRYSGKQIHRNSEQIRRNYQAAERFKRSIGRSSGSYRGAGRDHYSTSRRNYKNNRVTVRKRRH